MSKIGSLIRKRGDPEALSQLAAAGLSVLPEVRRAYASLGYDDLFNGLWLNLVLGAIAPDPLGEALDLLPRVSERQSAALAWLVRRFAMPGHAERLRLALDAALEEGEGGSLLRLAVVCEGLGIAGDSQDLPRLARAFQVAADQLAELEKDAGLGLMGAETAPAAASAAAALLAISERQEDAAPGTALVDESARAAWREMCVSAVRAEGYANSYLIGGAMSPPMPFLFARAPREALKMLEWLARGPMEESLIALRYWLLSAEEQKTPHGLRSIAPQVLDWLETVEETLLPGTTVFQWTLDIRRLIDPARAAQAALGALERSAPGSPMLYHAVEVLLDILPFEQVAPLAVEVYFLRAALDPKGRSNREEELQALNQRLGAAGLKPIKGWGWPAPAEAPAGAPGLSRDLYAIASLCRQAAGARSAEAARPLLVELAALSRQPVLKFCLYRNLLLALARNQAVLQDQAGAILLTEGESKLIEGVLSIAADLKLDAFVSQALEDTPALAEKSPKIQYDNPTAEKAIRSLLASNLPDAGQRLLRLARKLGWGGRHATAGIYLLCSEAMGWLGVAEAVPVLESLIGTSGLGSENEIALLRIAKRCPGAVSDELVARTFDKAVGDDFAHFDSSTLSDAVRNHILRVLRQHRPTTELFQGTCMFITEAVQEGGAPPQALALLLMKLPAVVGSARANPGEEWEDRNWGGYNLSDAEKTLERLGAAIVALCTCVYSRADWEILLRELSALKHIDLERVPLGESGVTSYGFQNKNLATLLQKNLRRLGDAGLEEVFLQVKSKIQ